MILVLIETEGARPLDTSLQAWGLARSLGPDVRAVSFGEELDAAGWVVRHPGLTDFAPEAWGESLAQLVKTVEPEACMASGTERGNEVMAHLAAKTDLPMAANVLEVEPGEAWELTRIRWGGSLLERARLTAPVKLVTVALHTRPPEPLDHGSPNVFSPELGEEASRTRVVDRVKLAGGTSLANAKVIVSGGRGVGSAEGFSLLEELAGLLGGAVGCSRVVTNNGWRPHSDQVGQTGTRVAPDLYVACGISGAIQHWVGMMAAKKILAINLDSEAPMVTKADYAVIGNLHEVLPALIEEIRRRRSDGRSGHALRSEE